MTNTIETDLDILGLSEYELYEVKDNSDYVDFNIKSISDNKYDLYIIKSKYTLSGNGTYLSLNLQSISMEDYIEDIINNIKNDII